jgi:probable rRNA maturation factor
VIDLSIEGALPEVDAEALERDAGRVLVALGLGECELSLLLCDDAFIRPLNAQWRGKDSATDVLSFPQEEDVSLLAPPPVLGDVVISAETAARQATELGHPVADELRALLVHGVLHLLGYDHETDEETEAMLAEEARLHAVLGLPPSVALLVRAG